MGYADSTRHLPPWRYPGAASPGNGSGCVTPMYFPRPGYGPRKDIASFDDGPLRLPFGYLYTVILLTRRTRRPFDRRSHQSGARREVRVVHEVAVERPRSIHVIGVIRVGVRRAQPPVDGADRPYPNTRRSFPHPGKQSYLDMFSYLRVSFLTLAALSWSFLYQPAHI